MKLFMALGEQFNVPSRYQWSVSTVNSKEKKDTQVTILIGTI